MESTKNQSTHTYLGETQEHVGDDAQRRARITTTRRLRVHRWRLGGHKSPHNVAKHFDIATHPNLHYIHLHRVHSFVDGEVEWYRVDITVRCFVGAFVVLLVEMGERDLWGYEANNNT